jgi:type VI secretion system protein ImpH
MSKRKTAVSRRIVGISARQDFFELLRRIEWASHSDVRLGEPGQQQIRIYQPADLSFAPREVADVRQPLGDGQTAEPVIITCRHFGLFAPYGPLPIHITEHARNELLARRNRAFQDFAGILSQRMAILHYRAWSQLHVAVGHDHKENNRFRAHLCQIVGLPAEPDVSHHIRKVREAFPGAYLPGRGSLRKLQEILTHYFSVPVRLTPHKGTWIDDTRNQECQRMGHLGSTRIGKRFFDAQHSLAVSIGPVIGNEYLKYQRGSERLKTLVHLCHDFVRHRMVLDVSIIIQTSPDMACHLRSGRLGLHSWLNPGTALTERLLYKTIT